MNSLENLAPLFLVSVRVVSPGLLGEVREHGGQRASANILVNTMIKSLFSQFFFNFMIKSFFLSNLQIWSLSLPSV